MGRFRALLRSGASRFRQDLELSNRYIAPHYAVLGWVSVAFYPGFHPVLKFLYPSDYQGLGVRIAVAALSVPLIVHQRLPLGVQRLFPAYVYALATFGLPFAFGFILIVNGAASAELGATKVVWIAQYLVGLFLYVQLTSSVLLATFGWIVTVLACLGAVTLHVVMPNWLEIQRVFLLMLPTYFTAVFVGSITNRNKQAIDEAIVDAVAAVGSNIAHEMRTPLLSIKSRATLLERFLPALVEDYLASPREDRQPIRHDQIDSILESPNALKMETDYANTVINLLLANAREVVINESSFEVVSMSDLVEEAMDRYPFSSVRERQLVSICAIKDFSAWVPKQLVVHVLFNLLKNSLYFVQQARKGHIKVLIDSDSHTNGDRVIVEDTGPGIAKENQKLVFRRFYSTKEGGRGSGIGLSYCKMVMEGIGGSIACESRPGEFCRFILTFRKNANTGCPKGET